VPGLQPLSPLQLPHAPHDPQEQLSSHARMRLCVPELQLPHSSSSDSFELAMQPPVVMQPPQLSQSPQLQASVQLRVRIFSSPHTPQPVASPSLAPVEHSPSALQASMSHSQFSRHTRRMRPHCPQLPVSSIMPGRQVP